MAKPDVFDVLLLLGLAAFAAGAGCAAYALGGPVVAAAGVLLVLGLGCLTIGVQGKRGMLAAARARIVAQHDATGVNRVVTEPPRAAVRR